MLAGAAQQDETNFVSISLATLRIDSTTSFDIFFQPGPDQPMVLYAERNLIFSEAARQRLVIAANRASAFNPSALPVTINVAGRLLDVPAGKTLALDIPAALR